MRLCFICCNIVSSKTDSLFSISTTGQVQSNQARAKIGASWPNGVIPYFFDNKSYDHIIAMRVRMAMNALESSSCIIFKPIIGKPNLNTTWLHIANPLLERECMHEPRYNDSGEVLIVLGLDCLSEQQILHTLMHGIGFKDEVSHPQRDQYIRILWNNIQPAYHHLFRIQADESQTTTVVEYDPMSVMHFHDRAFSVNGHATIAPMISGLLINPSDDLSQLDRMKLRLIFGHECKKRNIGDLLDTCKIILHDNIKLNMPGNKSVHLSNEISDKVNNEGSEGSLEEETDNASKKVNNVTLKEDIASVSENKDESNVENLNDEEYENPSFKHIGEINSPSR